MKSIDPPAITDSSQHDVGAGRVHGHPHGVGGQVFFGLSLDAQGGGLLLKLGCSHLEFALFGFAFGDLFDQVVRGYGQG